MKLAAIHSIAGPVKELRVAHTSAQNTHAERRAQVSCRGGFLRAAFTLIELLLAVVIFAIALLAIHGVFYGAIKLRNKTADALDMSVPLQHVLTIMKRDLANIVPPGGTLAGPLQTTPTTTEANLRSSALTAMGGAGRQVSPEFHTATGRVSDVVPWGDIQRVAYYLVEPTNNVPGKDLVRVVWRNLLPISSDRPEAQWLMGGVQDVVFYFFDGVQWTSSWDSTTQDPPLPSAIRVEIELANGQSSSVSSAEPFVVEILVPVSVQARTNQSSGTLGMAL